MCWLNGRNGFWWQLVRFSATWSSILYYSWFAAAREYQLFSEPVFQLIKISNNVSFCDLSLWSKSSCSAAFFLFRRLRRFFFHFDFRELARHGSNCQGIAKLLGPSVVPVSVQPTFSFSLPDFPTLTAELKLSVEFNSLDINGKLKKCNWFIGLPSCQLWWNKAIDWSHPVSIISSCGLV